MKKYIVLVAAFAMAGITSSANAWWGGPFNSWFDDFFGANGGFSFSFSMSGSGHGRGWNRYYDYQGPYGYPYAGTYAPPGYGYPETAMTPEQQSDAQQRQAQALQQAVEAQRHFAEQMGQQPESGDVQPPSGGETNKGTIEQRPAQFVSPMDSSEQTSI